MPQRAFVEDLVEDEYARDYEDYGGDNSEDEKSGADAPPKAPSPPPADEGPVNVFDFLVTSTTPNASTVTFPRETEREPASESKQLVRFDYEATRYLEHDGFVVDGRQVVQYGTGRIPSSAYETPAPRKRSDGKKDKKRKRLHIETDQVMTDAPPVLHSGLTGGLNRMMRPVFPPSPDYSGGDVADVSPASPLKKSRHSKHSKSGRDGIGNNLLAMVTNSKSKTKKRKVSSSKKHHHRSDGERAPKLIEYRPASKDGKTVADESSQMVVYRPRVDLFLSFIDKGPDSERGCSMNKALKRFHRERTSTGGSLGKHMEEKELWRSLRMRRNEKGEIVLFSV